jgi:hypothetical protein
MRRLVARLGILLALGCQASKSTPQAQPVGAAKPTTEDAGSAHAAAPPGPPAPGHVTLPRSPATPPIQTTRPLGRAELARLSAFEFQDFRRQDRGTTDRATEVRHTTTTRPTLGVTVTIGPCDPAPHDAHACPAMELESWQARRDELRQALPEDLSDRPDTRFEIGARELSGVPAIYTYQLGALFGKDEQGQPVGAYSDAYVLYYNDGVNQIRVTAAYLDDAVGGSDHLLAIAPREDLEKLAAAFASFYVHAWP